MGNERRYKVNKGQEKKAIVLRCPDLRLPGPHKGFISEELGLQGGTYLSLKRAGGAIALARAEILPEEFRSLMSEISMFLELHPEIEYIIIINHEDCKKYDQVVDRKKAPKENPERSDLLQAAKVLSSSFPRIQIGAYYAEFADKEQMYVYFETVFETDPKKSLRKN